MKTIVFCILIALSYNYCNAQLKVENSIPQIEKKDAYDISNDLYIRDSHRANYVGAPLNYESYQKFINQRIFCLSDNVFVRVYALKRQFIKLATPIEGAIQYKKKQLTFSINQIATYLYHPMIRMAEPQSSNVQVIDDMRGDNADLSCYEKDGKNWKLYAMTLYNAFDYAFDNVRRKVVNAPIPCAGHSFLIKKILTEDEALSLLKDDSRLIPKRENEKGHTFDRNPTFYYESTIAGKIFLTESVQNNTLVKDGINFGENGGCESPVFLLETENGELFLTRLNKKKSVSGQWDMGGKSYTTFLLENHIAYLKEKYIGKLYKISHYPDPSEIGKIEDIVARDNILCVKYVNVETQSVGYRTMEWNSTGNLWVISWADEITPE